MENNNNKTPEQIAAEAAASQKELRDTVTAADEAAKEIETAQAPTKKIPVATPSAWYKPSWKKAAYVTGGLAIAGAVAFGLLKILGSDSESAASSDGE